MPNFYSYQENGIRYSFNDVFVPSDAFRQGNLWGWGSNGYGQLGNNSIFSKSAPVTTFAGGANWKQVACGSNHTAAVKTDGTLWTWGSNYALIGGLNSGQLGDNTAVNKSTPVTTFAGGANWKQVSCGNDYTAAIKTDGTLWVWGKNRNSGLLGTNESVRNYITPVTTFAGGNDWKQVDCGYNHTAAIKTDGTLWTWGLRNTRGQLGTNDAAGRITPVTTFAGGNDWKQVACGTDHTAAVKTDGTLWVWGWMLNAQLGNNISANANILTPITTFAGGSDWKQVTCGSNHTAAVKTDGTLWVWGANLYAQLGTNTSGGNAATPITTFAGGTNWKQVSGSGVGRFSSVSTTAAIKTDGTLWMWGRNDAGQLGTADLLDRSTPVTTFAGGTNWKQVAADSLHTFSVTYFDDYQ